MNYLTGVNSEIGLQNAKDYQGQKEVKNTLGKQTEYSLRTDLRGNDFKNP